MTDEASKTYTEAQVQELIKTRTAEIRESRNTLQAELNEIRPAATIWEKKATGLKAELDALADVNSQFAELQQKHSAAETRWGQDRVLLSAGITDQDVAEVLRGKYERATEPGDFGEWFQREGKTTPLVAAFLPPESRTPDATSAPEVPAPPAMPSSNNGTRPAPPPAQPYTPGSISGMSREERAAAMPELLASIKLPFN